MYIIYIVATGQHVGKTTLSLGLVSFLREYGLRVHFAKPVGQQVQKWKQSTVDKDSILLQSVFGLDGDLTDMSPVTVPRGFVEHYIFNRDIAPLKTRIEEAYERLSENCDVLVAEGTGHAGVGSCFDLSNADVAAMLGAHALVVVEGGIGKSIDEVALNISLFKSRGVEVLGVVVNKVFPDKTARIKQTLGQGLSNLGLRLLGVIPYERGLTFPRMSQIAQALQAKVLCGDDSLNTRIENILIAAMEPENVLPRIEPHSLMITPGDRIDNILVALSSGHYRSDSEGCVEGLVLTGGFVPHKSILELMRQSGLPVLLCEDGTYPVSAEIQRMVFKILPEDTDKIQLAQNLVRQYVDTEAMLTSLTGQECMRPPARPG
jgi:dethiobiotin synthase